MNGRYTSTATHLPAWPTVAWGRLTADVSSRRFLRKNRRRGPRAGDEGGEVSPTLPIWSNRNYPTTCRATGISLAGEALSSDRSPVSARVSADIDWPDIAGGLSSPGSAYAAHCQIHRQSGRVVLSGVRNGRSVKDFQSSRGTFASGRMHLPTATSSDSARS